MLVIVIGLPLALVMRRRPEDYGETVDGAAGARRRGIRRSRTEDPPRARDFTAREALRTPAFWLLSLGHGFALFVVHARSTCTPSRT